MTKDEVMAQLEAMGPEQTRKTWRNHGCTIPMFGVKVGDLKTIVKKVKMDPALGRELYATGNTDAMYLAGLITPGAALRPDELDTWVRAAGWSMHSESTVPWVASEHSQGWEIALRWIDDPSDLVASAGWATLSCWVSIQPDDRLDLAGLQGLLDRVARTIHQAGNRVRYTMNSFVIAVGVAVPALTEAARATARTVGPVTVNMGGTACQVPEAIGYIQKSIDRGQHGKKRKTAKC